MSRPLPVLAAGGLLALAVGGLVVLGVYLQRDVLVLLGVWALGSLILLVQLDTWRRTRSLRRYVRDQVRAAAHTDQSPPSSGVHPAPAPTAAPEDVIGAVRLLQAQYVGRLDRMQTSLEDALAELAAGPRPGHRNE